MGNIEFFFKNESSGNIVIRFYLFNDDTITFEGNSVEEIFFDISKKFPDNFPCRSISFSGKTLEQSERHSQEFLSLARKYGRL